MCLLHYISVYVPRSLVIVHQFGIIFQVHPCDIKCRGRCSKGPCPHTLGIHGSLNVHTVFITSRRYDSREVYRHTNVTMHGTPLQLVERETSVTTTVFTSSLPTLV